MVVTTEEATKNMMQLKYVPEMGVGKRGGEKEKDEISFVASV